MTGGAVAGLGGGGTMLPGEGKSSVPGRLGTHGPSWALLLSGCMTLDKYFLSRFQRTYL